MKVKIDDAIINYEECGQGQPLILLHGNGGSNRYFKYQVEYFKNLYRVIAIDTRGHGSSTWGKRELRFNVLAEDLHRFVELMQLHDILMLGFSDGGNIALTYALKYPQELKALVLNAANLYPSGMKPIARSAVEIGNQFFNLLRHVNKKAENLRKRFELMTKQPNLSAVQLENLHIPTLVIAGEWDIIRKTHTRLIADSLPDSEIVIIRKAGHFCARQKPQEFNSGVEQFFAKYSLTDTITGEEQVEKDSEKSRNE